MNRIKRYACGLRLIVDNIPSFRSISSSIWVKAGSICENNSNNGISHFIEHMIFKGTARRSSFEIAKTFEDIGGSVNAFTSKECTCYYVKSIDSEGEKCFDNLCDIFFNSTFPQEELDRERRVIIEEINMVEDEPEDVCYDMLAEALYPDHKLSRTILGPSKNVLGFGKDEIDAYRREHYNSDNIVIAFAGNITLEEADVWVNKYVLPNVVVGAKNRIHDEKYIGKREVVTRYKDYEQSNLMVAYPSLALDSPQVPAEALLSIALGGSMSSRLFQQIREKRGLAYSIYTNASRYEKNGSFNICLNFSAENTESVIKCVDDEMAKLIADGITEEEFLRARAQLCAGIVFGQESVQSCMLTGGKLLTVCDKVYDMDTKINEINSLTTSDINSFIKQIFVGNDRAVAYLGKDPHFDVAKYYSEVK